MLILHHLERDLSKDIPHFDEATEQSITYFRSLLDARIVCSLWARAVPFLAKREDPFFDVDSELERNTDILFYKLEKFRNQLVGFDVLSDDAKYLKPEVLRALFVRSGDCSSRRETSSSR